MTDSTQTLREILSPPVPVEWQIETEVTRYFRLVVDLVGSQEAIRLFDSYGLNSDETYPAKIELAEWLYTELLDREIRSPERSIHE